MLCAHFNSINPQINLANPPPLLAVLNVPFGVAACAIEVWVFTTELSGVTFFSAPCPVWFRVHQMVKMLKFWIAPECGVDAEAELRGGWQDVGVHVYYIINGCDVEKSCAGTCFETFQDKSLGKGSARCPGWVVVMSQREVGHHSVWAWGEHASHSCVDAVCQFLV